MDFVVGHPRSGTAFISALLNAARPGVAAHELLALVAPESIAGTSAFYAGALDEGAVEHWLDGYQRRPDGATRIDCHHKATFILPVLRRRYPRARILHLVRHPQPNVRSCYELDYYGTLVDHPDYQTDLVRNAWVRSMPAVRRDDWATLGPLERNCAFWTETHRLALAEATTGPSLRLRLEDVGDDDALGAVYDFFELPRPSSARIVEVRAKVINDKADEKREVAALREKARIDFAPWNEHAQRVVHHLCGEMAGRLGYTRV